MTEVKRREWRRVRVAFPVAGHIRAAMPWWLRVMAGKLTVSGSRFGKGRIILYGPPPALAPG